MDAHLEPTSDLIDDVTFWNWVFCGDDTAANHDIFAEFIVRALLGSSAGYDAVYYGDFCVTLQASAVIHNFDGTDTISVAVDPRATDCHIICVFAPHGAGQADVVDPWQWCFFVLSPDYLASLRRHGEDVSLDWLTRVCTPISHDMLHPAVNAVLSVG